MDGEDGQVLPLPFAVEQAEGVGLLPGQVLQLRNQPAHGCLVQVGQQTALAPLQCSHHLWPFQHPNGLRFPLHGCHPEAAARLGHAQAKGIVGLLDCLERLVQPFRIQPFRQVDQVNHQVKEGIPSLPPVHLLHLGQVCLQGQRRNPLGSYRTPFALRFLVLGRLHLFCDVLCCHPHIPLGEIQLHGKPFLQLRQQGQQGQGVHPLGDKAPVRLQRQLADLPHTRQHLRRQRVLGCRFHQRLLVQLPVVVELELLRWDQLLGDHILWQAFQQLSVERLLGRALPCLCRVISHQLFPSARFRQQRLAQSHA